MSEKYIYTRGLHDPTTWESSDFGVIRFHNAEEARKAAKLLVQVQEESYANGYATAIETAAQILDETTTAAGAGQVLIELAAKIRSLSPFAEFRKP